MKFAWCAVAVLSVCGLVSAEDAATTSAPATHAAPASAGTLKSTDQEALKSAVGKSAVVIGGVASVSTSPSGSINFINFKGHAKGDFTGIIKKEDLENVNKGFDGDVAKALKGKEIELSGVITDYKGTPQIEVTKPEQIKIVAKEEKPKE